MNQMLCILALCWFRYRMGEAAAKLKLASRVWISWSRDLDYISEYSQPHSILFLLASAAPLLKEMREDRGSARS